MNLTSIKRKTLNSVFFKAIGLTFLLNPQLFAADTILINGAGATFPYPLYSKWFSEYRKVDPGVQLNYNSIGSGGGIRQLMDNTVDFGATDSPMTDEQLGKAKTPVVHFPMVLGAVVLTYNVPGAPEGLKVTPELLAEIFLGTVKNWNDPKIAKLNPGATLPKSLALLPVYRSDGSGTSGIFTDYLAKISPEWKTKVGQGTSVRWPAGLGGKGNEGVTGIVKQTPGAVGYVELIYAENNKLPVAEIQNKNGKFTRPSVASVTAAASGALKSMPADFRISITNADGADSYPIAGFTYLLVYQGMTDPKKKKIAEFLAWAVGPGQKMAPSLSYAPLPESLIPKVKEKIKVIAQ